MALSAKRPEIVDNYLRNEAKGHGHDDKAVERLLIDSLDTKGIWQWLALQGSPVHAHTFVVAALQAYSWIAGLNALSPNRRAAHRLQSSRVPGLDAVFKSRKRGAQSDFLRLFIYHLACFQFPIKRYGIATQIAAMARALMCTDVDSKHVSKLLKERS